MYQFEIVEVPEITALVLHATCTHTELGPTIAKLFQELAELTPDLELSDAPKIYYREWRHEDCEITAAFPVEGDVHFSGVEAMEFPGGAALMTTHPGSYEGLPDAWTALWQEAHNRGIQCEGACWDSYVSNAMDQDDPAQWVTEIYIPIL